MSELSASSESPELVSVAEAARMSGVSDRTVRRWIASGRVRTVGHGHVRRVVVASLSGPADTSDAIGHEKLSPRVIVSDAADTATDGSDGADTADVRDDRLSDLVALADRLAVENRQLAEAAAVWQERARVLGERLALGPSERAVAANLTRQSSETTSGPSRRYIAALAVAVLLLVAAGALVLR